MTELIPLTDTKREETLRLAGEVGAAEASRRTGIPASTIRVWRSRTGRSGPPAGVDVTGWADSKEAAARDTWATAETVLGRLRALIETSQPGDAKSFAITFGILTEKSIMLEQHAANARERRVKLNDAQGELMVRAIEEFLTALGLPFSDHVKALLAWLLQRPGDAPMEAPPDLVAAARSDLEAVSTTAVPMSPNLNDLEEKFADED